MLSLQRIESGYGESNVLRGVNLDVRRSGGMPDGAQWCRENHLDENIDGSS